MRQTPFQNSCEPHTSAKVHKNDRLHPDNQYGLTFIISRATINLMKAIAIMPQKIRTFAENRYLFKE